MTGIQGPPTKRYLHAYKRDLQIDYEYEIEYEHDFSNLVCVV